MQKYKKIIEEAKNYVKNNIENGVSVDDIAQKAGYSTKQLNRIFVMMTGITPSEYLRWTRLTKSYELKYSNTPIIELALKYGYESQEGFTRIFKGIFGITPGEYRSSNKSIDLKNWHISDMLHQESHNFADKGLYSKQNVNSWIIHKPARIWASARRNHENLASHEFYDLCSREGVMDKTSVIADVLIEGGAILTMEHGKNQLCFGVELTDDYSLDSLDGFEVFHIPESLYVVFNCPSYMREAHGSVIKSLWAAQKEFIPNAHGLEWNFGEAPVIESDSIDKK